LLDRELSYLELLENLVLEGVNFVIRLKWSDQKHGRGNHCTDQVVCHSLFTKFTLLLL
jgi:hypothetical protein